MHDKIFLSNIKLCCIIGLLPKERLAPQAVIGDIALELPLDGFSNLNPRLDYSHLFKLIESVMNQGQFALLESAAEVLGGLCLGVSQAVQVSVTLAKPEIIANATPGVSLVRRREHLSWQAMGSNSRIVEFQPPMGGGASFRLVEWVGDNKLDKANTIWDIKTQMGGCRVDIHFP